MSIQRPTNSTEKLSSLSIIANVPGHATGDEWARKQEEFEVDDQVAVEWCLTESVRSRDIILLMARGHVMSVLLHVRLAREGFYGHHP